MKKYVNAIKYALETLNISADTLFNLIETSKGYNDSSYDRWLSGKIIEMAEAEGVGFSQLLVKKFNILSELSEGRNVEIEQNYLDYLDFEIKRLNDINDDASNGSEVSSESKIYTYGLKSPSQNWGSLEEVDFFNQIDYGTENLFFIDSLPDELKTSILSGKSPFISDLSLDCKNRCINIKYDSSLCLYRMCLLYDTFYWNNNGFIFVCPSSYLYSEYSDIFRELMQRYKITGFSTMEINRCLGEFIVGICEPLSDNSIITNRDYIVLQPSILDDRFNIKPVSEGLIYTRSSISMLQYIKENTSCEDKVYGEDEEAESIVNVAQGNKKALGYMVEGVRGELILHRNPVAKHRYLPIMLSNLEQIIAYYGLIKSNRANGVFTDIKIFITGHKDFIKLVANCLPIFLFDTSNKIKGFRFTITNKEGEKVDKVMKNRLVFDSDLVKNLFEKYEVYFAFEAKEVVNIVKEYYSEFQKITDFVDFNAVRKSVNNADMDRVYYNAMNNLKRYVSSSFTDLY